MFLDQFLHYHLKEFLCCPLLCLYFCIISIVNFCIQQAMGTFQSVTGFSQFLPYTMNFFAISILFLVTDIAVYKDITLCFLLMWSQGFWNQVSVTLYKSIILFFLFYVGVKLCLVTLSLPCVWEQSAGQCMEAIGSSGITKNGT